MARIVIVGAGISGLAAALEASASRHEVVVLEGSPQIGGKLRLATIAGQQVDVGAESMLARRPEGLDVLADLDVDPVHPAKVGASIWTRDALRPMPRGTVLGVPGDPDALTGLLTEAELARVRDERIVPISGDLSVGELVESAVGSAVVDRLVEPLLGGVYAGHARRLSAAAAAPALLAAARHGRPLTEAARPAAPSDTSTTPAPVFAGLRGGMGSLPKLLVRLLLDRGVTVRTGATVREVMRAGRGWRLTVGETRAPELIEADAVVMATPARPTSRLLQTVVPDAAQVLSEIEYASMTIVTYAFDSAESAVFAGSSGFLVPPVDGRGIKASTFSSSKWPWLAQAAPDRTFVRVSIGRHGEEAQLQSSDAELAAVGMADLRTALGESVPRPVAAHVQRWGGALPQYAVGHLDRITRVRDALTEISGLEVAGAAYEGVGIPACIGTGRKAASAVLTHLAER